MSSASNKPADQVQAKDQDLADMPLETMEDRVKAIHRLTIDKKLHAGPDTALLKNARLLSVSRGKTTWEIDIEPHFCNLSGNLHGGAAATILDNLTSMAFVTLGEPGQLGPSSVSRTLTTTYLRPVPLSSTVRVETKVTSAGRTLINLYGEILVNDKVCVTCVHDKAIVRPSKI